MNVLRIRRWGFAPILGLLLAGSSLSAQDWAFGLNVRGGITSGGITDDMRSKKMLGLGVDGSYSLGKRAAVFGELTFTTMPGKDYFEPMPGTVTLSGSTDRRKNSLQGFGLRGGYRAAIADWGWSWQAGLSFDKLKSRQEVSGQIQVGANIEALAATPESNKMNLGAFAGMHTQLTEDITFQFNVATVGYSQVNWVPQSYSGQPAAATTRNRRGIVLEAALGFRF